MFAAMNGYALLQPNTKDMGYWVESLVNRDIHEEELAIILAEVLIASCP